MNKPDLRHKATIEALHGICRNHGIDPANAVFTFEHGTVSLPSSGSPQPELPTWPAHVPPILRTARYAKALSFPRLSRSQTLQLLSETLARVKTKAGATAPRNRQDQPEHGGPR